MKRNTKYELWKVISNLWYQSLKGISWALTFSTDKINNEFCKRNTTFVKEIEDTTAAAAVNQPITGGLLCYVYPMKGKRKIRRIITTTTGSKVNTRDE